mmetsp:Transcript_41145/g.36472  ORF Transcript_41145/g.36472 Transcript_41145/m.36472 type:complete len:82 (-) Transcript_41145:1280-1525(-)
MSNVTNRYNAIPYEMGNPYQAQPNRYKSFYSKAKKAQHAEKNLEKAEKFYRLAIQNQDNFESSVKDLATILHQQARTKEAI